MRRNSPARLKSLSVTLRSTASSSPAIDRDTGARPPPSARKRLCCAPKRRKYVVRPLRAWRPTRWLAVVSLAAEASAAVLAAHGRQADQPTIQNMNL